MSAQAPEASIVISTRNRREDLLRAVESAWAQNVAVEVLVYDDASHDGSVEAVRAAFPRTRVFPSTERLGYLVRRNQGARAARAPYFVSLDDDAVFAGDDVVAQALTLCDDPRIGAIAMPVVDVGRSEVQRFVAPDTVERWVTDTFPGCAALLARAPLLALGGFREALLHRGEEPEYARRMFRAGRVVRLGTGVGVRHHPSPVRDPAEDIRCQVRGEVIQGVWGLPAHELPVRCGISLAHGLRHRHPLSAVRGLAQGGAEAYRQRGLRDPLTAEQARWLRRMEVERLRRRFTVTLDDVESALGPNTMPPIEHAYSVGTDTAGP